jgi:hypothetical protein
MLIRRRPQSLAFEVVITPEILLTLGLFGHMKGRALRQIALARWPVGVFAKMGAV